MTLIGRLLGFALVGLPAGFVLKRRVGLLRATLELLALQGIGLVLLMALQVYLPPPLTYQTGLIAATLIWTLFYAMRLRLPPLPWWQVLIDEAITACFVCGSGSVTGLLVLLYYNEPRSYILFWIVAMSAFVYLLNRFGTRILKTWNRLREKHLAWSLTHAHMVVITIGIMLFIGLFLMVVASLGRIDLPLPSLLLMMIPLTTFLLLPATIAMIGLLPFFAVFSYFATRHTVQRLKMLVAATDALSRGDYAARSPVKGEDEVAHLQANFNEMAARLQQTLSELRDERDSVSRLLQLRRELMTSVSHELRTPIATLRAYVESMRDSASPETMQHDLQVVTDEVIRLQTLVDDLFTLSRAEVGQLLLHCAPTDVGALVQRSVDVIAPLAWSSYRVQVIAQVAPQALIIHSDVVRMEQILRNLLHNSLQHTPPGGIVTIEAMVEAVADQHSVCISVEDTGEGIAPEELLHVWERFFRGKDAVTSGAGLGLALVKELTEAMNGKVEAISQVGEGSRFSIRLPISDPALATQLQQSWSTSAT